MLSVAPAGCAPVFLDHSAVVASANSISNTRFSCGGSIFPAQDAHHGGAQQHVRVAALVHRAAMRGSFLQQVVHGHGAAVVVDVVAALAVGEDLDAPCS